MTGYQFAQATVTLSAASAECMAAWKSSQLVGEYISNGAGFFGIGRFITKMPGGR